MERKDILNILDNLGIFYKSYDPRDGSFFNDETLFIITNNDNTIYMYNFRLSKDEYNDYELSGETFFMTPTGALLTEAISVESSSFYEQDIKDIFIVSKCNPTIDYGELDEKILEFYTGKPSSVTGHTVSKEKTLIKDEIIL